MLTDLQLRNFDRFRIAMDAESRGARINPTGAYDSALGARRHGLDPRDFSRGGAFDAEGGASVENVERLVEFLTDKLSPDDLTTARTMLYDDLKMNAKDGDGLADRVAAWAKTMRLSDQDCAALMKIIDATGEDKKPRAGRHYGADARMRRASPSAADVERFNKAFPAAARVGVGGL